MAWLWCRDGEEERRGNSILNRSEVDLAFTLFSGALLCTPVPRPYVPLQRALQLDVPRHHKESPSCSHSKHDSERRILTMLTALALTERSTGPLLQPGWSHRHGCESCHGHDSLAARLQGS